MTPDRGRYLPGPGFPAAIRIAIGASLTGLLLTACDGIPGMEPTPEHHRQHWETATLQRGERLYQQHCMACHGENREGAQEWYRRDAAGHWPPPPLDGSGHDWHHPLWQLRDMIRYGGEARGGTMPSFEDTLNDSDVDAIIAWLQSQWPEEIFEAWTRYDRNHPTQSDWEDDMGEPWITHPDTPFPNRE